MDPSTISRPRRCPSCPKAEAAPATGTSAQLNLQVPQDAKVVINNYVTNSTGTLRRYVSRGLQPNSRISVRDPG